MSGVPPASAVYVRRFSGGSADLRRLSGGRLDLSGILLPTLTAAAFAALYAEFLAWFMGAPATLFLIPALLIPLVPGRPLYYAMYYAVQQDMDLSADFARQTALYALGIALGASLVWALADMRRHLKQNGFGN